MSASRLTAQSISNTGALITLRGRRLIRENTAWSPGGAEARPLPNAYRKVLVQNGTSTGVMFISTLG